ncbi:MAG: exosortase-associated EpsI family protein [Gemmataceae bacterium]
MTRFFCNKSICIGVALALILGAGLVHGLWAERWYESQDLEDASARVALVPREFGDWVGKDAEADAGSFAQAGARSYLVRNYTNKRTHASFLVILMCGRPGKMAVHRPEVCYQGAGYEMMERPRPYAVKTELGDDLGSFWTARFDKGGVSDLRLYWGWAANGPWQATAEPRWQFRGESYLYKLYVSHDAAGAGPLLPDGPAQDFLRRLTPELRKVLFAAG